LCCRTAAKPFRHFLEGRLKFALVNLEFAKTSAQCDAADPFGLPGFCCLELILELGDFFADFRRRLFHSARILSLNVVAVRQKISARSAERTTVNPTIANGDAFVNDPIRS
jgi:hypothetical protein